MVKHESGVSARSMSSSPPVIHVHDRTIFANALAEELTTAGIPNIAPTRDQRIRYRSLEKQALINHGVGRFTFTQGQEAAIQCATRIIALAPKITAIAASQPRPFLYSFGLTGGIAKVRLRIPGRT